MGLAAVDDVDAGDALLDGLDAAVDLGDHAAGDGALVFERLDVLNVEVADDIAHLDVVAQALDVGEDDELFRTERAGELARGGIAVDVVGVALPVGADGGDDGDEARVEHGVDGVGVDVVDVADEAELLTALVAVIDVAAHAGEADRLAADLVDPADQLGVDLTDEEKADLKETLEKYKTKIESGAMTVNDAATDYALKVQQDSTYQTGIKDENGMQSSYMPDAFISAIKEMNEGDVEVVESTKYMIVLHRLPIKDDEDTLLESSDNRSQLLLELKNTEYADAVSAAAQSFEGVEWNQKVLNRYKPSMFADTKKNGTSSVASESSDESASSEESSAKSSETSSETSETSSESSAE